MVTINPAKVFMARQSSGLTQSNISVASKLSIQTVGYIERNGGKMHENNATALARALGCKLADITEG